MAQPEVRREPQVPSPPVGNEDVNWDTFESDDYFEHNYGQLRWDDAEIIRIIADYFRSNPPREFGEAIDVGTGTNFYPSLTMLPYAGRVTMYERAFTNRTWLEKALKAPQHSWTEFWEAISKGRSSYDRIGRPFELLADRADVVKGNVFELERDRYDLGTMFFVAESITTRDAEFARAARKFVVSLKPGAPFAAAFMRNSSGYIVGDQFFPACSVSEADVEEALAPVARRVEIRSVESNDLRDGYCGMMVATGRSWRKPS